MVGDRSITGFNISPTIPHSVPLDITWDSDFLLDALSWYEGDTLIDPGRWNAVSLMGTPRLSQWRTTSNSCEVCVQSSRLLSRLFSLFLLALTFVGLLDASEAGAVVVADAGRVDPVAVDVGLDVVP